VCVRVNSVLLGVSIHVHTHAHTSHLHAISHMRTHAQHIHIHIHTHTHTQARQWSKAGQIVDMQDDDVAERYYKLIGQHFDETKHFDKAER